MNIQSIKRPWQRSKKYGHRLKRDPFYQSPTWKHTKAVFKQGTTIAIDGKAISTTLCIDCYNRDRSLTPMHTVDHIVPVEEGGSRTEHSNLQSLCLSCHNRKSAIEGNKRKNNKP